MHSLKEVLTDKQKRTKTYKSDGDKFVVIIYIMCVSDFKFSAFRKTLFFSFFYHPFSSIKDSILFVAIGFPFYYLLFILYYLFFNSCCFFMSHTLPILMTVFKKITSTKTSATVKNPEFGPRLFHSPFGLVPRQHFFVSVRMLSLVAFNY